MVNMVMSWWRALAPASLLLVWRKLSHVDGLAKANWFVHIFGRRILLKVVSTWGPYSLLAVSVLKLCVTHSVCSFSRAFLWGAHSWRKKRFVTRLFKYNSLSGWHAVSGLLSAIDLSATLRPFAFFLGSWPCPWKTSKATFHALLKLAEVNFCVSIHVKSPQNTDKFLLRCDMCTLDKEALQVAYVYILIVPVIDGLECLLKREIIGILYYPFHLVCFQLKPYFLIKQLAQRPFNTAWQEFTSWHFVAGSLSSSCSQKWVITGQQDLEEVVIV